MKKFISRKRTKDKKKDSSQPYKINKRPMNDSSDEEQHQKEKKSMDTKSSLSPQHKLLVYGYVRLGVGANLMEGVAQICHEFYHKNVIVYQSQKNDPSIEEWSGMSIGGSGGGRQGPFIHEEHSLLTKLFVADLTLYDEDGISIQGYKFEKKPSKRKGHYTCNMGRPPEGIRNKRWIKLQQNDGEYCNGATIYYGGSHDGIRGIEFKTNHERIIMIGKKRQNGKVWSKTELILPHLQYGLIGFQGRSGWLLDQISFIFAPQ